MIQNFCYKSLYWHPVLQDKGKRCTFPVSTESLSNGICFTTESQLKHFPPSAAPRHHPSLTSLLPTRALFEAGVWLDSGSHRLFFTDDSVWVQPLQACYKLSHCFTPGLSSDLRIELNTYQQQILTGSLRASVNIFESFHIPSFRLRVSTSILTPCRSLVAAFLTLNDLKKDKKIIKVDCDKIRTTVKLKKTHSSQVPTTQFRNCN